MIKRIFLSLVLLIALAVPVMAGEAVYNEGSYWTPFNGQTIAYSSGTYYTSASHSLLYDSTWGIYIDCSSATGTAGMAYQLSYNSPTTNFEYPSGISWITDTINSTTAKFIPFEPQAAQGYIRFLIYPLSADASLVCTVKLYEQ